MDVIYVRDIKVDCVIGVWEWERRIRQQVRVDVEVGVSIEEAAGSDQLEHTVSYKAVAKRVVAFAKEAECALVESLAVGIATLLMKEFEVQWCRVKVNKFGALRGAGDVGVVVERGEDKKRG